jgi:hypothetical protein
MVIYAVQIAEIQINTIDTSVSMLDIPFICFLLFMNIYLIKKYSVEILWVSQLLIHINMHYIVLRSLCNSRTDSTKYFDIKCQMTIS